MLFWMAEGPELIAYSSAQSKTPRQRHQESCCRHRRQLAVHRKMLNLKRSRRPHPGKIWSVADYWTTRIKRRFRRHWPHLSGLASVYARENSVAFNWTGSCVTCDRGVAEDSALDGPGPRVHGQRSTRRRERGRAVPP